MKSLILVLSFTAAAATTVPAQFMSSDLSHSGSYGSQSSTVKGYVIDAACAAAHVDALLETAKHHPTACALGSVDSGIGVVSKGAWYPLDDKGVQKAVELMKKSPVESGMMVQMSGSIRDNRFVVSSIKEVKP